MQSFATRDHYIIFFKCCEVFSKLVYLQTDLQPRLPTDFQNFLDKLKAILRHF